MTDRYTGKPFLLLLDSYVLDAIDYLDAADEATLAGPTDEVRRDHGLSGDWRAIVTAEMNFPDGMQGAIREIWTKGRDRFVQAQGHEPDPGEFTRNFVDTNFPR